MSPKYVVLPVWGMSLREADQSRSIHFEMFAPRRNAHKVSSGRSHMTWYSSVHIYTTEVPVCMVLSTFTLQKYLYGSVHVCTTEVPVCTVLSTFTRQKYLFVLFSPCLYYKNTRLYSGSVVCVCLVVQCIFMLQKYAFVQWFNAYLCYKSMRLFGGSVHICATCSVVQCIFMLQKHAFVWWFNCIFIWQKYCLYGGSVHTYATEIPFCFKGKAILVDFRPVKSRERLARDAVATIHISHTCRPCSLCHKHRLPGTRWQYINTTFKRLLLKCCVDVSFECALATFVCWLYNS